MKSEKRAIVSLPKKIRTDSLTFFPMKIQKNVKTIGPSKKKNHKPVFNKDVNMQTVPFQHPNGYCANSIRWASMVHQLSNIKQSKREWNRYWRSLVMF